MGRAIDMENSLVAIENRLKLVEDALTEMIQTRVHHVDLTEELVDERNVVAEGVEIEPEEKFTPPTSGKRRATPKITTPKKVESLL